MNFARNALLNLVQLRLVCEVVRSGLNISNAAKLTNISQPGASKQIRLLEDELQTEIFIRDRNRLVGVTPKGVELIRIAEQIVENVKRLRELARATDAATGGRMSIAVTHTQARHVLPHILKKFSAKYPDIQVSLVQASPQQIPDMVFTGKVDIGISVGSTFEKELIGLHAWSFDRVVVVPRGHELASVGELTLEAIARFPMVTYEYGFKGRNEVIGPFDAANIPLNISIGASDADVIKNCVALGLGIAVLSEAAIDPERDSALVPLKASHLFPPANTFVVVQKRRYFKPHEYHFLKLCNPRLTKEFVERACAGDESSIGPER
jgi:LysR family cys regulon transcriptional activator